MVLVKLRKGQVIMGVIYKITNQLNSMVYIGQTTRTLEKRMQEHLYNSRSHRRKSYIDCAIGEYGIAAFDVAVIEECDTKEKLNEREIYWISFYDCMSPKGYNLTPGGYINYSLEIGRQLSKINKGKKRSPEVIAKISASKKGHPVSEETREKISKANKGKKLSPETCAKMSAGRKNKRAVVCLETGQIFESVSAAARWAKVESCTVSATVNGRTASAGGFHWLFADADVKDDEIELKPLRAGKRSVRCVETDEIFESITAAAQFANASSGNIQRVLNKSNRTAGGYHWVDVN